MNQQNLKYCEIAFSANDYVKCSEILLQIYHSWISENIPVLKSDLIKALQIIERLVALPEIELSDYIIGILAEEKVILESTFSFESSNLSSLHSLANDLNVIINYFEDYLSGLNSTPSPLITVGIEAEGKFCFYENIYESVVNEMALETK